MQERHSDGVRIDIVKALAEDETLTAAKLAEMFGCSRQRVYQIARSEGLTVGRSRPNPRIKIDGPMAGVSHSAAGTIGEMLAAADLLARGWSVFFPLVRTSKCDLIALSRDGRVSIRVEVRSGSVRNGKPRCLKKPDDVCDHYAVVLAGLPIVYQPDLPPSEGVIPPEPPKRIRLRTADILGHCATQKRTHGENNLPGER